MFSKEIENMFSVFLSRYRNTRESLGELEKAVDSCLTCGSPVAHVPTAFLVLPNLHSYFYKLVHGFYSGHALGYTNTKLS